MRNWSDRRGADASGLPLYVEPNVQDVAVGDDEVLAFDLQVAGVPHRLFRAARNEAVVGHHLGADEAALAGGVDLARRLFGLPAATDGPGPYFVRPDGEERYGVEQAVGGADE